MDNQINDQLFTFVNILPFLFTGFYLLFQTITLIITKKEYLIEAIIAETVSMILKGLMQIVTIFPDANPNNPHCTDPVPEIISLNIVRVAT